MEVEHLFTVGHSTRSLEELVEICKAHGVGAIADVRAFPGSRRYPHFARTALERTLPMHGVHYLWLPALGGRRHRPKGAAPSVWRVAAFAAYAEYMNTPEFRAGFDELRAAMARCPIAVMCAEATPYKCHRRLISDWAELHGIEVTHLMDARRAERHHVTPFARRAGEGVAYTAGDQLGLPVV
jgi:uncharacterized protein (DUF488 family)